MPLWRLLVHGPASAARNMAVDEALLREVRQPVLRLYEWRESYLSLGYFQPAALAESRSFIRRYTGGGMVDHAHDFTYTIVLPRGHPWMQLSAPESYATIHRGVRAVLMACGINSELISGAARLDSEACFQKPVRFDLMLGLRKISGAAQRRTREGLLHQGSILLPDPTQNEVIHAAFAKFFFSSLSLEFQPNDLTAEESVRALDLERTRYSKPVWNHSR